MLDAGSCQGADGGCIVVEGDRDVVIEDGAIVSARGDGAGHGGTMRLVADDMLHVRESALVNVEGGAVSVRGGSKLEISGHRSLNVRRHTQPGEGGTLLIDPGRLQILNNDDAPAGSSFQAGSEVTGPNNVTVGQGYIENKLRSGTSVVLVADEEVFADLSFSISGSTGRLAEPALPIGFVNSSPSGVLGASSPYDCSGLGACGKTLFQNGEFQFQSDSTGSIRLAGVHFFISGILWAETGTAAGDIEVGDIFSEGHLPVRWRARSLQ